MPFGAMAPSPHYDDERANVSRALAIVLEINQVLLRERGLLAGLHGVVEILHHRCNAVRSVGITLNPATNDIEYQASAGAFARIHRTRFRIGDGLMGRVVQSGKPVIVPQVSLEPALRGEREAGVDVPRQELTYIAVPIALDGGTVGGFAMDLRFVPNRDYPRTVMLLDVAASLVAHALKVHRLVAAERQRLLTENSHLREELKQRYDFSNIIGTSGPMRRVYEQTAQVARTNTTVILRGESGTGKELFANAIHYNSPRAKGPLIKVNCAALPHDLIESELFGYEKGAFTGAMGAKKGRFELAQGGTLFLDEIGDLNAATQVKLLRVLQEREFERLGGVAPIRADLRLIVATNKNLEKAIVEGSFREDLYYRLNVFAIFVPPLRERRTDIMLLADHFLEAFAHQHRKHVKRISTPAIDMLMSYHWPGNVRELENAVERAVVVCDGAVIHAHHLPPSLQTAEASDTMITIPLEQALAAFEKDTIQDALKSAHGNRAKAARLLRTTARILNYKIRKHAIDWRRFRQGPAKRPAELRSGTDG
ncbi:MAG: sigma 54-interacting transcriptional regulator [Acidobacteriota bacterium]